jgi:hypothetical protein
MCLAAEYSNRYGVKAPSLAFLTDGWAEPISPLMTIVLAANAFRRRRIDTARARFRV